MTPNEQRPVPGDRPSHPNDRFEDDLRRALAGEAAEPAPERLVARVAAIPRGVRPERQSLARLGGRPGAGGWRRLGFGLVAAAAVVVVAGIALLGRPVAGPPVGGPTPTGAVASSPSPSADASASATASPAASTSNGPTGGPVPAGFQPVSVTFASADDGWVLGTVPCTGSGTCDASIVRTIDGGRTWTGIPAPQSGIVPQGETPGPDAVRGLRFADALDGWAFGPALFATHDGGATWRHVTLPGTGADSGVMALETSAGFVHAAFFDGTGAVVRIATSPVGQDAWTVSPTTVPVGAGPVPHAQLVLHGAAGWLIEVDRTVVGGARLAAGEWQAWQPPCLDANGPATLAAATERGVLAACDVGVWSTPTGVHLYASADGGTTFVEAAAKPPVSGLDGVAASGPGSSAIVVAGSLSGVGSALVASFDGGRTWAATYTLKGAGSFSDVGFTTADQGVAITTSGVGEGRLLMTRDGGRSWSAVSIPGG